MSVGFRTRLGIRDPLVAGERLKRHAMCQLNAEYHKSQNPGTVHVKDGKPLTALGAKLLGLPWPPVV
jgi:hypothetical protein